MYFYPTMQRPLLYIAALCMLLVTTTSTAHAAKGEIAAVVNDTVITMSDLENRVNLYSFSSDTPPTPEQLTILRHQVLNRLIDEALQIEEAQKLGIQVTDELVEEKFKLIAEKNQVTPEEMKAQLKGKDINIQTLYDQIRAENAWGQVVQRKLRPKISVSESEIEMTLERIKDSSESRYHVAEIFLRKPDSDDKLRQVQQRALQLVEEIKKGAPFSLVAQKYSEAPGAAKGGDLGWVREGQVSVELSDTLAKMKPGEVSLPILSPKGYHILLLRDVRSAEEQAEAQESEEEDKKSRALVANQLGTKRLMQMAVHHLNDLRSTAFIDKRTQ